MIKEQDVSMNHEIDFFKPEIENTWRVERNYDAKPFTQSLRGVSEPQNLYCLFISLSGTGKLITTDNTFIITPNTLFIAKVDNIITYNGIESEPWIYICFNYTSKITVPYFDENIIYNVTISDSDKADLERMFNVTVSDAVLHNTFIFSQFLSIITKWAIMIDEKDLQTDPYYKDIKDCLSYIQINLDKNISVADLAKKYNMSCSTLYRSFLKITGVSPKTYIIEKKLNRAKYLLQFSPDTIETISEKLGYYSPFQFSRDFKKRFGVSPKNFRLRR